MEESELQFTLREIKSQVTSSRFWVGMLGVICILAISGPFLTAERFNIAQRFVYWGGIAVSTYFLGISIILYFSRKLDVMGVPLLGARIIAAFIAGVLITVLVYFVNTQILGIDESSLGNFFALASSTILISMAITAIFFVVENSFQKASNGNDTALTTPLFFKRLPKTLGTDLISLQAQDHYVEVKTTKGSEMVLIRLSDAIAELSEIKGLQTHRSWWVTTKHISGQRRKDGKPFLTLSNGTQVPISRTYQSGVKQHFSN